MTETDALLVLVAASCFMALVGGICWLVGRWIDESSYQHYREREEALREEDEIETQEMDADTLARHVEESLRA